MESNDPRQDRHSDPRANRRNWLLETPGGDPRIEQIKALTLQILEVCKDLHQVDHRMMNRAEMYFERAGQMLIRVVSIKVAEQSSAPDPTPPQ